jgi:predicted HTH domain antitoxin
MNITLPDDILQSAKISEAELKLEIAIVLYQQKKISLGQARRLAGISRIEFQKQLANRGICLNYDLEALESDLKTLQEWGDL